jgi:hypothetical protein
MQMGQGEVTTLRRLFYHVTLLLRETAQSHHTRPVDTTAAMTPGTSYHCTRCTHCTLPGTSEMGGSERLMIGFQEALAATCMRIVYASPGHRCPARIPEVSSVVGHLFEATCLWRSGAGAYDSRRGRP